MALKRYKANRKGGFRLIILLFLLVGSGVVASDPATFLGRPLLLLPLLGPIALLLWMYANTHYELEQTTLRYQSGFVRGQLEVWRINQVQVGVTQWTGVKPALAGGGLLITYNRYDEIYLAPADNEALLADLLAINPAILVKR
ncbi:PH domain-containing protein [Fibrella forsythiae]|uniref:PH domain-containing protein n=1 Tax=Fibrella forsythiae TaxID=2817061 RepID=A0ABS3JT86_9BACT|nr:PH domain-containing protein [Fibrella forsythiae]MBO0953168.1 PH domain-containing protein [Fibrella forsythiae]